MLPSRSMLWSYLVIEIHFMLTAFFLFRNWIILDGNSSYWSIQPSPLGIMLEVDLVLLDSWLLFGLHVLCMSFPLLEKALLPTYIYTWPLGISVLPTYIYALPLGISVLNRVIFFPATKFFCLYCHTSDFSFTFKKKRSTLWWFCNL